MNWNETPRTELERRAADLRREIILAKEKRRGLDNAITSRTNSLARVEAQLVLTSAASPAPSRS